MLNSFLEYLSDVDWVLVLKFFFIFYIGRAFQWFKHRYVERHKRIY